MYFVNEICFNFREYQGYLKASSRTWGVHEMLERYARESIGTSIEDLVWRFDSILAVSSRDVKFAKDALRT